MARLEIVRARAGKMARGGIPLPGERFLPALKAVSKGFTGVFAGEMFSCFLQGAFFALNFAFIFFAREL